MSILRRAYFSMPRGLYRYLPTCLKRWMGERWILSDAIKPLWDTRES